MENRMAVILAAGKGTRMKSSLYKVLHPVCGLPMVAHVVRAVEASGVNQIVTIVGHGAEAVQAYLGDKSSYALQAEQLGTGHAVLQAESALGHLAGSTLVICGDTPLLTAETLSALFDYHQAQGEGQVLKIVEQKDATEQEALIREFNTGTYVFDNQLLFDCLKRVGNDNAQGEYYLPDVIALARQAGRTVAAYVMADETEAIGVNDRVALAEATQSMRRRINEYHMRQGVTMIDPASTYIEADVVIGPDTVLEANVSLKGQTRIGAQCQIGANTEIHDSQLADGVSVTQSVIESSTVATGATVGPFAHLRPNSHLGQDVHIGNFVEVKNSTLGAGVKSGHLTYIGDADLGRDINIGCGTIFVNYDGKKKHRSTVGDQAFIGCNANIVSPVKIGDQTFIAAGTTVTHDVPDQALAISRVKQDNIPNYWQKFSKK